MIAARLPVDMRCTPTCEGWLHARSDFGDEIERCDDCNRFEDDDAAILAHRVECGCDHPEQARRPIATATDALSALIGYAESRLEDLEEIDPTFPPLVRARWALEDARRILAPDAFKICGCGRIFTRAAFDALPACGEQITEDEGGRYRLELRHCSCGSTIGIEAKVNDRCEKCEGLVAVGERFCSGCGDNP